MASTICELQWISYLMKDDAYSKLPIPLYCDNHDAIHISQNAIFHELTKHLEIDCNVVREKFKA